MGCRGVVVESGYRDYGYGYVYTVDVADYEGKETEEYYEMAVRMFRGRGEREGERGGGGRRRHGLIIKVLLVLFMVCLMNSIESVEVESERG